MAILDHEGDIPEEYLTGFEREMQETEDGKVTKTWKEYAKGYVPRGTEEVKFDDLKHKSSWHKDKDELGKQVISGTWQTETRGLGKQREQADRASQLMRACQMGDTNACSLIQSNTPGFSAEKYKSKQQRSLMSPYQRKGFAQGGMLDDTSRLWKMESTYPEFQKGVASRVSKERVPTTPIEEQYMYSPTQGGYPPGYAEGGSVYDTEGSMLAPEVPLDFEDEAPVEDVSGEENELGLTDGETEVLGQAMSDYPELENILNKVGSTFSTGEFTADGAVEGPGTETSDSIPARLSDGEFVFTAKAVKQLGVDKLRKMMDKAEGDYDEASQKQEYQQMSDTGFAKGGFFDRPKYEDGGEATQSAPKPKEGASIGTIIKNYLFSPLAYVDDRTIDPDTEEVYASEEYQQKQRDAAGAFDDIGKPTYRIEDELSPEDREALERGNEAIYPEEEYPHLYNK